MRLVLAHYPVASIRDIDISPGLFTSGPWGATLAAIEGEKITLDDVEHRILRPIWRDPRIHYVLNCAALGCPDIPAAAFEAGTGEAMLEAASAAYINHPRGAAIRDGKLRVSRIYDWYGADFGDSDSAIIAHLAHYAEPALRHDLEGRMHIDGYDYDWALNDAR